MSWVGTSQGGISAPPAPPDLEEIFDEELLKQLWHEADDFSERRRIRARMYKLKEKRLREMIQNDEENLGVLATTEEGEPQTKSERSEAEMSVSGNPPARKSSNIEVTMRMTGDSAITDNVMLQNVTLGGITMRGPEYQGETSPKQLSDEEIIEERIKDVSKDRTARYKKIVDEYNKKNGDDAVVSLTKSTYSIQSDALAGDSNYQAMKHKEIRDGSSPTRQDRKSPTYDSDGKFASEDESFFQKESDRVIKAIDSGRKNGRSEISTAKSSALDSNKRITSKKTSSDSDSSSSRPSSTSPTRRNQGVSSMKTSRITTTSKSTPAKANIKVKESSKTKMDQIAKKMDNSLKNEYSKLDLYLSGAIDPDDELIAEEEEEALDNSGSVVKMVVQTRRKKDGTEYSSRRVARSTKIVEKESDIDEILIGNPDHEILSRDIEEKEDSDGSKIKIITELRRRPDGIEYTTKNVLRTSKICDYDHPEEITYSEDDELVDSKEDTETDEQGRTIRTVTETRKKSDGTEYTTKKVFKRTKGPSKIIPSDDDEILDSNESEEVKDDGTIIKTVIQKRRTKNGEEYTHRQVYRTRRMTLSGIELQKGLPMMNNDDKVLGKKEKEDVDGNGKRIKVVTETRQRADGSTYTFDYVIKSFKTTETDLEKMPIKTSSDSGIVVNVDDKLIKEDVKEELQKDGSTIKTIIERRRAKDGTEYLRHRIMRIPKLPEPILQVGSLDDEVLEGDVKEKVLEDGTHCKSITERRRSSVTGMQYTLRRMSKIYHPSLVQQVDSDEIIDENMTEEETTDGILVKTIIRRYQRPDGSVYTTHDIQRTYTTPIPVIIDQSENDKLVDRSYDERETSDGYIVKTIMETRCRADGLHYTVERVEKISKYGPEVDVSFKGDSLSGGGPGDTIISREEHEEPNEDGAIMKTMIEIRRRQDGTEYTNKTSIRSTEVLVPEHETSYVVIKSDDDHGFMPSLDDEIVYTRKKEEVDEKGNAITVIIETRQNKTTGEKYNLTKKVHTTDVLVTEQGEKILSKKSEISPKSSTPKSKGSTLGSDHQNVSHTSVSALMSKFSSPKTKENTTPRTNVNRTNTANKKMFFEQAATKSASTKTANKVEPKPFKSDYRKPQKNDEVDHSKKPLRNFVKKEPVSPIEEVKRKPQQSPQTKEKAQIVDKPKEKVLEQRKPQPSKAPLSKSPPSSSDEKSSGRVRKMTPESSSDEKRKSPRLRKVTPESSSDEKSKPLPRSSKSPLTPQKSLRDAQPRQSSIDKERRSPSPTKTSTRGRSPLTDPRDTTLYGGRQCCKRASEALEKETISKQLSAKSKADERTKVSGTPKRLDSRTTRSPVSKNEEPDATSHPEPRRRPDSFKQLKPSRQSPKISDKNTVNGQTSPQDPIVTLPQTPMTEDIKAIPTTPDSPLIEDVSTQPDLPHQTVHRPSLVREPSENLASDSHEHSRGSPGKKQPTSPKSDQRPERRKPIDKPLFEKAPSLSKDYSLSSSRKSETETSKRNEKTKSMLTRVSSSEDDDKSKRTTTRRPYQRKLSGKLSPEIDSRKKPFSDSGSGKLKDWEKSVMSQIEPNQTGSEKKVWSTRKMDDTKGMVSLKKSIFDRSTNEKRGSIEEKKININKPNLSERTPVNEPLCVKKHVYKMGENSDEETHNEISVDGSSLPSAKLVLKAMSPEPKGSRRKSSQEEDRPNYLGLLSPSRERSTSPFSKSPSPHPRSKESSPAPFSKEGSPNFVTGRAVDHGLDPNKIKRLERSNSNKKAYEEFEEITSEMATFINDVETITDVIVLEKMLQKLDSYEERRIVRGRIRTLKRTLSSTSSTTSTTNKYSSSRFISPQPSRPRQSTEGGYLSSSKRRTQETPLPSPLRSNEATFKSTRLTSNTGRDISNRQEQNEEKLLTKKNSFDWSRKSSIDDSSKKSRRPSIEEKQRKLSKDKESSEKQTRRTSLEKDARKDSLKEVTTRLTSGKAIEKEAKKPIRSSEEVTTSQEDTKRSSKYEQKSSSRKETTTTTSKSVRKSSIEVEERISSTDKDRRKQSVESEDRIMERKATSRMSSTEKKGLGESDQEKLTFRTTKNKTEATPSKSPTSIIKNTRKTTEKEDSSSGSEPLRHQRTSAKAVVSKSQTDVEKIISPYGVGPTDENGLPLFGLRALRRRKQVTETEEVTKVKEPTKSFEPNDSNGRPMFGIKAIKKSPPESTAYTATHVAKETTSVDAVTESASVVTEKHSLTTGVVTQQTTHATEVVSLTNHSQSTSTGDESSEASQDDNTPLTDRRQRRLRKKLVPKAQYESSESDSSESAGPTHDRHRAFTKQHMSEDNLEYACDLEVARITNHAEETSDVQTMEDSNRKATSESEEDEAALKAVNLKDMIRLHESKVSEPAEARSPSPQRPKQKLRESFEPTVETTENRTHRTWDLETDLSTRSEAVENIIAHHETLTKTESTTTTSKPQKKLTGILKKTSTTSAPPTKIKDGELSSTDEQETTRKSSVEKNSDLSESEAPKEIKRKTSYTEIVLSPSSPPQSLKIESSSSATIDHDSTNSAFRTIQKSSSGRKIRGYESVDPLYQEELQLGKVQVPASETSEAEMPGSGRSFLDDKSKVTGISDVLTRMSATEAVDHESRATTDDQAKSLLNKFLGAQVLMSGVESMMNQSVGQSGMKGEMTVTRSAAGSKMSSITKDGQTKETRSQFSTGPQSMTVKTSSNSSSAVQQSSSPTIKGVNIDEVTDTFELNQLLDSCEEYDERRRIRMRLKALMADRNILDDELKGHGVSSSTRAVGTSRAAILGSKGVNSLSSEDVLLVNSWLKENFPEHSSHGQVNHTISGVSQKTYSTDFSQTKSTTLQNKTDSPFNKFKQLDAQHPKYSTSGSKPAQSGPLFQLSANVSRSASGVKDMILMWCQCRTRDYKGVKIENFSTSWNDGLAFCALIHHFFPDAFNFDSLDPKNRRYNFSLAFRMADEKAGVYPLLDVDDMVMMMKPDWKCVFTYVQALYKRLKDE